MIEQPTNCPYCKSVVLINIRWAIQNGRVFCNSCCKAFDIHVGEEENEAPTKEPDAKVETALEELEKEMDKAVDEFDGFSWF